MGRLTRLAAAACIATSSLLTGARPALGFDGFGAMSADATYGEEMVFSVELSGTAPDQLELLLGFPGSEADFVARVEPAGEGASYRWDAAASYVTPNTRFTYRWRATEGDNVTLSDAGELLYDDDRPGLAWSSAQLGEATVHWYGGAEGVARRFGEVTAAGVAQAEELLGSELVAPVDIFVYATRDDFLGALGPGVREWTGAAAFPEVRTIFMWLEADAPQRLEEIVLHEVTHVVFHDATDNPYHVPAQWLDEGFATWSETRSDAGERAVVEEEAGGEGLFAFEAITNAFPISRRGGLLAYAQGATMVELLIDGSGDQALARAAAAYRDGASDDEALEAATGGPASDLYETYFETFGVEEPAPIRPEPILPSNVDRPAADPGDGGEGESPTGPLPPAPAPNASHEPSETVILVAVVGGMATAILLAVLVRRSASRSSGRS